MQMLRCVRVEWSERAADSVCSLPRLQPNSGLPEFGHLYGWPKSDISDFGWRGGEGVSVCR
jgi:hypothetical protein